MLYERLRNIACHVWGVAPWEFEGAVRRVEVMLRDVMEAVYLESAHMEIDVGRYLLREREADLERRHREVMALVGELDSTVDPKRRKELLERIDELNGSKKG